jgi:hypothetical protein
MQLSVIAPYSAQETLCSEDTHHLTLVHWMLESPEYMEFYQMRVRENRAFVILDNGAHENKRSEPLRDLIQVAKTLQPHEIVLPDAIGDADATIEATLSALPTLREEFPHTSLMAVPQGRNLSEWLICLGVMLEQPGIDCIGIPRIQADIVGSWVPHVLAVDTAVRKYPIHLLGSPYDLTAAAQVETAFPGRVRSTDTSKPVHYAIQGITIDYPLNPAQRNPLSRPKDFLTRCLNKEEVLLAKYNIAALKRSIGDITL